MSSKSIHKFILLAAIMMSFLPSCSDSEEYTVSGDGSLSPLTFNVNLLDRPALTRALDKEFEVGDQLLAYLEHVDGSSNTVSVNMSPSLVTLAVNTPLVHTDITNGKETSSLSVTKVKQGSTENMLPSGQTLLYWDDFSSSSQDINTAGHGVRVKYGYCFNGRTPVPSLTDDTGVLSWSVIQDQKTANKVDYKKSDLLWSKTQTSVAYQHQTDRLGLTIPYTHAMSKVTLVLIANDGFSSSAFASTSVTLLNMFISGTMSATDATISGASSGSGTDSGKIFMYKNALSTTTVGDKVLPCCVFEALVMPTKELNRDLVLASISDVEGNNYNISVTDNILKGFNRGVDSSNPDNNTTPVVMKSGVNYKLTITLDKQPQNIVAQITDWSDVSATATAEIKFTADITSHDKDNAIDTNGASFALWRKVSISDLTGERTTTATFDNDNDGDDTEDTWVCTPTLYWPDGNTSYHFRALAKYDGATATKYEAFSGEGGVTDDFKVKQGSDIVWATTAAHTGNYTETDGTSKTKDYGEGAAIDPRTGTIPMAFEHAMSKISVKLETSTGADAVDLTGAKISIASLYNGGTINLEDGEIKDLTAPDGNVIPLQGFLAANDNSGAEGTKLSEYVVVPQSLTKMANGTDREGTVSFYNKNELKDIEGVSYVISSLEPVCFTESEVIATNADLVGSVKIGDQLNYTESQFLDLKASEIPESLYEIFKFGENYADFIASATSPFKDLTDEDYLTIKTLIDEKSLTHNDVSAKAYNSKLTGAIHTSDVKGYQAKTDGSSIKAKPGDIKTNGVNPKIMMLIMLADGTTYTLNLADCVVDGSTTLLDAWERGNHYTYTISLQKEKITFRAMIKDWEEKSASGNATLDWD